MTNKTINRTYWLIVTLLILLAISPIAAMACEKSEESTEFGCKPLIDCYPCEGGWCYYKDKK